LSEKSGDAKGLFEQLTKHFFSFDPKSPSSSWVPILFCCVFSSFITSEILKKYYERHDMLSLCAGVCFMVGAFYSYGQLVQKIRHLRRPQRNASST
jgi:hypothetical protein